MVENKIWAQLGWLNLFEVNNWGKSDLLFYSTVQVVCKKRGFDDPLCSIVVVQGIGTNQAAAHKEATPNFLTHFLSFLASVHR